MFNGFSPVPHTPTNKPRRRRRLVGPVVEPLEKRDVPATVVGVGQLQATQVVSAIAISTEAAFEANYKVFSKSASVFQVANLISAFLHAEQNALAVNLAVAQQSTLTQAIMQQSSSYVSQEVNTLETWFFKATSLNQPTDSILTQLDTLAQSFQATEKAATTVQAQELSTGVTVATSASAFTYLPPDFINPGNGGLPLPVSTPSIIHPSQLVSLMNNDQITQYLNVANAAAALTTTALTASANPSTFGNPVTFTANVSAVASAAGVPTGTVTFNVDGTPQAPVTLVNGQAQINLPALTKGSHTITANYSGDANFQLSSVSLTQQVN